MRIDTVKTLLGFVKNAISHRLGFRNSQNRPLFESWQISMLHKSIRFLAIATVAMSLSACVTTKETASSPAAADPALSSPDLKVRADAQAKAYKANPQDGANAVAYAESLGAMNQHEQQSAVLERVVMAGGGEPDVMSAYGKSLISIGEYARADQVLSQAFMPDMPDWRILSARGVANDKLGNHREARNLYEHALRLRPDEPSVLTNLGLSYGFERDYAKAEVYLRKALAQPGSDPRVQQNLALILGLQGKKESEKVALAPVVSRTEATDVLAATSELKSQQERTPRSASPRNNRGRGKIASY